MGIVSKDVQKYIFSKYCRLVGWVAWTNSQLIVIWVKLQDSDI